jgi:hypothetical protein
MIKKYIEFINEGVYPYGCILLETPISNWIELTSMINPEDLYKPEMERFDFIKNKKYKINLILVKTYRISLNTN